MDDDGNDDVDDAKGKMLRKNNREVNYETCITYPATVILAMLVMNYHEQIGGCWLCGSLV